MKKFALLVLVLLLFASPLYSRPKVEISLSHMPLPIDYPEWGYPEWYKIYDLNLVLNPSSRFGFRLGFGELDFSNEEYSINGSFFNHIEGIYYFTDKNVSPYVLLDLQTSYSRDEYTGGSYYWYHFYTSTGFGMDWYFSERAACFIEIRDFLMFVFYKSESSSSTNFDGFPKITLGLKLNIYSGSSTKVQGQPNNNPPEIEEN
jgi:hypothetical protein